MFKSHGHYIDTTDNPFYFILFSLLLLFLQIKKFVNFLVFAKLYLVVCLFSCPLF